MGQSWPLFVYFSSFHIPIQTTNRQFEQYKLKKAKILLWTQTPGGRMEGADESTELWRPPFLAYYTQLKWGKTNVASLVIPLQKNVIEVQRI